MPEVKVKILNVKEPLTVNISHDDHVSLMLNKIAVAMNVPPGQLYIWVKQRVQKNPIMLMNFINNVFAGNSLIDARNFIRSCAYYFGLDGEVTTGTAAEFNMITKTQAYKTLVKMNITHIIRPVTHFFTNSRYLLYLPYDPNMISKHDEVGIISKLASAVLHNNEYQVIDNIIDIDSQHKIHVAQFTTDIPQELNGLYFPFQDNKPDFESIKKFVKYIHTMEKDFQAPLAKPFVTQHYLNGLQLRSQKIPRLSPARVDMAMIFNAFQTSQEVPFIKYKASTNIFHKVSKTFLAQASVDVKDFEKWYSSGFKNQDKTYIVFKIFLRDNVYASLIMNDELELDVRITFSMKQETPLDGTSKYFKKINKVIDKVRDILKEDTIPSLPKDLASEQDVWEVQRLITYHMANLGFKANKANAEKFVADKLFSYFDVIPDPTHLRLQYKKVSNYNKSEQITAFIQRHRALDEGALIELISTNFLIPTEDAQKEVDNWQLYRGAETTGFIKFDQYVEVNVQFNSPIDVKYVVSGASSYHMIDRITSLVAFILAASEKKPSATKEGTTIKEIFQKKIEQQAVAPIDVASFDDDDDWAAELRDLETEYKEDPHPEDPAVVPNGPENSLLALGDEKKLKGFVKKMLDHADPTLFTYKSESKTRGDYASICGWAARRQPIVITDAEKQVIDKKYPGAYNGYVKTGSTVELERRHYYICPKVWCPKSRVAVPPGTTCPGENEEPIVFESKNYWGVGEKAMDREHYPGFLDKYTRADGLCLPCCFKLEPKAGNRNKKRQEQCVPLSAAQDKTDEDDGAAADEATIGTEKYIKADSYFPLEVGRYGLLTKQLHQFLGKLNAGSRHNGAGLMTAKTETYLRKGIVHGNQSFINCVISTLDNPKIKSQSDFVKLIIKNLDILYFMTLENGKILQLFIDHQKSPYNADDFGKFREWFLGNSSYTAHFNLLKLRKELETQREFTNKLRFYKDILREFIIYYSYMNFLQYLKNNKIEKDHRILLDLINLAVDWLNIREYNYIIVDIDVLSGNVYIDCPINRDTNRFVNKLRPFVFIIKHNKYYEPLYYVKNQASDQLETEFKFSLDGPHTQIREMIKFYYNNCSMSAAVAKSQDNIALFLESRGYKPKYYVIDYDFRMCGLLLQNNLYVPFIDKKDSFKVKGVRFVYISDVIRFKCIDDIREIKKIYQVLAKEYGSEFYGIHAMIKGGVGLVLKNLKFVPLNVVSTADIAQEYLDDLYIFTGVKGEDDRTEFIASVTSKERAITDMTKAVHDLDNDVKLEIMFLRDRSNPLPLEFKREKLMQLLSTHLAASTSSTDKLMAELADRVLNHFFDVQQRRVKRFDVAPTELLFDYQDIQEGRVADIIERARNPYKLIINKLDNMFDKYVFEDEAPPAEPLIDLTGAEFQDVPAKYGNTQYRKILKGYSVLVAPIEVRDLFVKTKSVSDNTVGEQRITKTELQGVIDTNVTKMYVQKIDERLSELYENPSFKAHVKSMKLKATSLTLDNVLAIIRSTLYKPSFAEIRILARAIHVNVILIGRKTLKFPEGLFEVIHVQSPHYLFMIYSYDRKEGIDRYQLVVKDKEKVILGKNDLPAELLEMIDAYLEKTR
jgi:hypothetical protein